MLLLILLVMTALTVAVAGLAEAAQHGWQVVINGHEWDGLAWAGLSGAGEVLGAVVGLSVAAVLVVLVVFLVVPAVVVLALLLAGGGVGLALSAVLLGLAVVAAIVLSPLWLLWLLLRRRAPRVVNPAAAGAGARMNA